MGDGTPGNLRAFRVTIKQPPGLEIHVDATARSLYEAIFRAGAATGNPKSQLPYSIEVEEYPF